MLFGQLKNKSILFLCAVTLCGCLIWSCNQKDQYEGINFSSPSQGQNINLGTAITVKIDVPKGEKIDSVSYFIDGNLVAKQNHGDSTNIATDGLFLGYRLLTAIVGRGAVKDTIATNIVLKTDVKPMQLSYQLVNSFPHDTSAYTQGLAFVDGKLLESTGEKGTSALKWVDLTSGKTLKKTMLEPAYFGEGSLKIGDKIIMLTWQENIGLIFDAHSLSQIGTFPYQSSREGWGLAFDGKQILRSDGTNKIWYMDPIHFTENGFFEVYDHNGPVANLNELEYINGKLYANVYLTNKIIRIDPKSGRVEAELDLAALVPQNFFKTANEVQNNVLNGIAWDEKGKRLFVGGKKWPKLFEIRLIPALAK